MLFIINICVHILRYQSRCHTHPTSHHHRRQPIAHLWGSEYRVQLESQDFLVMMCIFDYWQFSNLIEYKLIILLWAPSLNSTSQHYLLRVIGNKWTKIIKYPAKMTVWATTNNWLQHCRFESLEDGWQWCVIELALESAKQWITIISMITCDSYSDKFSIYKWGFSYFSGLLRMQLE
jgi:hypothetical protein